MEGNSLSQGFVSLSNLVAEVLWEIDDAEEKKYQAVALQWVLNAIRDINVNFSGYYEEVPITLDPELRTGNYPTDLVKEISVGVYRNGEFWSFTKKPDMAKTMTHGDGTPDSNFGEDSNIPKSGIRFGARGSNFGYWTPDPKHRRFIVRNYAQDKVILRYRSNGITCTSKTCVPYDAKDLIVSMVSYKFAIKGRPKRYTAMSLDLMRQERARFYDQYTDLQYMPQNMDEFKDAEFSSLNTTVRR